MLFKHKSWFGHQQHRTLLHSACKDRTRHEMKKVLPNRKQEQATKLKEGAGLTWNRYFLTLFSLPRRSSSCKIS